MHSGWSQEQVSCQSSALPGPPLPPSSKDSDPLISPRESLSVLSRCSTSVPVSGQGGSEESDRAGLGGAPGEGETATPARTRSRDRL